MFVQAAFVASLLGACAVQAHIQLAWPYPLHSPLNPATPEAVRDYSMTSPLLADGPYPCKGFINSPSSDMFPVTSYSAGSTYNLTTAGTATHGGGSCQLSLSYDNGTTWSVFLSIVGGCPLTPTVQFTLPSDAPSGQALFAWTWFNLEGNREMYMDCAVVNVEDGGKGLGDTTTYPTPFVANANVNGCKTIEGTEVVFPYPGGNVVYGGSYKGSKPTSAAGFTGSNCIGPGASQSGSGAPPSSSDATAGTSSAAAAPISSPAPSVSASPSSTSSSASPAKTTLWTLSASSSSFAVGGAASPSSVASSSPATSSKASCKRKRSSATSLRPLERRHERLVPRRPSNGTRRVAAKRAEKPIRA